MRWTAAAVVRPGLRSILVVGTMVAVVVLPWSAAADTPPELCRPATLAVEVTPGRSQVVDHGPSSCNTVSLTFDAGADRGYAETILDILKENHVQASFGMTGLWAQQNPDIIQRMVDEGHEMINHTWRHGSFTGFSTNSRPLSVDVRASELERTEDLLKGITGHSSKPLFRPPYGDLNESVLKDVSDQGYDYTIMWTVDSLGWNHLPAAQIIDRCLIRADAGVIYIFHVGIESEDALALSSIISGLRDRGLGMVKITDMLGMNGPAPTPTATPTLEPTATPPLTPTSTPTMVPEPTATPSEASAEEHG